MAAAGRERGARGAGRGRRGPGSFAALPRMPGPGGCVLGTRERGGGRRGGRSAPKVSAMFAREERAGRGKAGGRERGRGGKFALTFWTGSRKGCGPAACGS